MIANELSAMQLLLTAPVMNVHRVTIEQIAILEPALLESVGGNLRGWASYIANKTNLMRPVHPARHGVPTGDGSLH
jgi:hypothetical protein